MSLENIHMSSNELLDKKEIDCGGFGKVYLCCHKSHGLVVLKTVFTGYKHDSYKNDLMQEGKIMCKLNHKRVVKLLGVILEDGNYSLVIEYMTKGNLLNVLNLVAVPISVKARFILEIIEGMIYLHSKKVIHKDLKPENVLADDNFHIKIADLGVAAFQKWSTLTKEETKRQRSRSGKSSSAKPCSAGTLIYMAPEHLKDINQRATEKSDVFSFGIVIWVILSNKEPYENAINELQLSMGVRDGQRPSLADDVESSLDEAVSLMKECWKGEPNERPSFEDCEKQFKPVYSEKYEKDTECDVARLQKNYPLPEAFIQRMASLQVDCDAEPPSIPKDMPHSLHSSVGLPQGNVNENSFRASNEPEECEEEKSDENLQRKLQNEMIYHQTGSRIDNMTNPSNPDARSDLGSYKVFNKPSFLNPRTPGYVIPFQEPHSPEQPVQVASGCAYDQNVHCMEAYGTGQSNIEYVDDHHMYNTHPTIISNNTPESGIFPYEQNEGWQGGPSFEDQYSTKVPVAESRMPSFYPPQNYASPNDFVHTGGTPGNDIFPKGNFGYSVNYVPDSYVPDKPINLTISNSKAIQIGNGNYMSCEEPVVMSRHAAESSSHQQYKHIFESNSLVNERQLQLLRENLSKKWKEFARKVGFRQPEIEEIDHDFERDGLKEKVFQMLHKWQMKEGSRNATVGKIAKALFDLGDKDLLNQLIHLNKTV